MAAVLSFILCLNACGSNASQNKNDEKEKITSFINEFYTNGIKETNAYSKDSPLLSAKLKSLMAEVSSITEEDAKRIKSSANPTDKGLVFEGPLFNGSEGGVSVTVLNVTTKENTAIADVEFEYTNDVKTKSKERVALVNENGWKIDNVFFHESKDDHSTQALLQGFVDSPVTGTTQLEMNQSAGRIAEIAEQKMNTLFNQILAKNKEDKLFIEKATIAQKQWASYAKAQWNMKYPHYDDPNSGTTGYGSVGPMCAALYRAELCKARTKELTIWMEGMLEGDVCSGSVGFKQ